VTYSWPKDAPSRTHGAFLTRAAAIAWAEHEREAVEQPLWVPCERTQRNDNYTGWECRGSKRRDPFLTTFSKPFPLA
jgi:hypothetical protein